MPIRLRLFLTKLRLSGATLVWLFRRWQYVVFAAVLAVVFFEIVYWLFNIPLIVSLLSSGSLSFGDRLSLLLSPFEAVRSASGGLLFSLMLVLSALQGLTLAALTFAIRHQPEVDSKLLGGSTLASLLAVIGLGCPACGTSLITPVVAMFISGSSVAVSEQITRVALPLAIVIGLYGIYVLGLRIATIKVQMQQ